MDTAWGDPVNDVVPRWEWRAFAQEFREVETAFATTESTGATESDEIYLLSPVCDANVKVRDAVLDIKTLVQVDAAGLEQWQPVLKGVFPLSLTDAKRACEALGVPPPSAVQTAYSLAELVEELRAPVRGVRVLPVHKRRVRYRIRDCMSEITDVVAEGRSTKTIALEAADARQLIDAVRAIGLAAFANTSYPRGLKRLIGMNG